MGRAIGQSLTSALTVLSGNEIPTIQFTPLEIIYNKIRPSIKLHLKKSIQITISVADPDPNPDSPDPHVFGPPGSFYHYTK
jgi:hypothetical protein